MHFILLQDSVDTLCYWKDIKLILFNKNNSVPT